MPRSVVAKRFTAACSRPEVAGFSPPAVRLSDFRFDGAHCRHYSEPDSWRIQDGGFDSVW